MVGVPIEILKDTAFMIIGSLAAAAVAGFSFLKSYEEFKKGIEKNSKLRIWAAFFSASFLIILLITFIARFVK